MAISPDLPPADAQPAASFAASAGRPPAPGDVVLPLCRAPLWRGSLNLASTAAIVLLGSLLVELVPKLLAGGSLAQEDWAGLLLCVLCGAAPAASYARRLWVRRTPLPPIVFSADGVQLPRDPEGRRSSFVPYDDILTVGQSERPYISARWPGSAQGAGRNPGPVRGRGGRALVAWHHFFVESSRRTYSLPQPMFRTADGHEVFFAELQRRISARPQGLAKLRATEKLRRPALLALRRRPLATQVLFGVTAVFLLNTWLKGALEAPFGLLRWGAMAPALAGSASESYRLLAATFLHGHWLHAGMNGLALSYLGTLLERLLGWQRMVLLYIVSGAVAMASSAWAAEALLSVGASGALFGLLGAFAWLSWRMGPALPLGVRQPWRWWASLLVINALVPKIWPVVDWVAHLAGFACGVVLMACLQGRRRTLLPPAGRWLQLACGVAIACQALALGQAVVHAAKTSAAGETAVAALLLRDPRTPAATLHNFAWLWALERNTDAEHLEAGRACAAEAVRRAPRVPDYRATLAELERRLGEWDAATADWAQALAEKLAQMPYVAGVQDVDTVAAPYAFQLALLLHRHPTGPVLQAERRGRQWTLPLPQGGLKTPRTLLLLARDDDAPVALFAVLLPAAQESAEQAPTTWTVPEGMRQVLEATGARALQLGYERVAAFPEGAGVPAASACPDQCWRSWRLPLLQR